MKRSVAIGTLAGAIVVVAGGGFAYAAQLFVSPKQMLLNSLQNGYSQTISGAKVSFNTSVNDLSFPSSAGESVIEQFNGASFSGEMLFNPNQKEIQSTVTLTQPTGTLYSAKAWVTGDQGILAASSLQPLLDSIGQVIGPSVGPIPQIPKYLVTDSTMSDQIVSFWSQLLNTHTNPTQQQGARQLLSLFIEGVPSQYITRKGLDTIQIRLSESDLETIGDSEISYLYEHQSELASAYNEATSSTPIDQNEIFAGETEAQAIQLYNDAVQSSPLTLGPTQIDLSKSSSGVTAHFECSVSLNSVKMNGATGTFQFSETATTESNPSITVPTPTPQNSMTFQNFFSQ